MKLGLLGTNGDPKRASIGLLQVNVHLNRCKLALAPTAIAVDAGKRALISRDLCLLPIRVDLNQEKFLLLQEKFLSPKEKFLLIQMKLRARHVDADLARAAAGVADIALLARHAALRSRPADAPSFETGVPSRDACAWVSAARPPSSPGRDGRRIVAV